MLRRPSDAGGPLKLPSFTTTRQDSRTGGGELTPRSATASSYTIQTISASKAPGSTIMVKDPNKINFYVTLHMEGVAEDIEMYVTGEPWDWYH